MLGLELDRGRTEPAQGATPPCPPLPFLTAGQQEIDGPVERQPPSHRIALAIGVAAFAIVILGAVFVAGGRGAKTGPASANALPGSGEVARVTMPGTLADRIHPDAPTVTHHAAEHGKHRADEAGGKDHSASDHSPSGGGGAGDNDGNGGGGGGTKPVATVNIPVVGTVTVEEPRLPPVPDVDETLPDLPDVPVPDVTDGGLP